MKNFILAILISNVSTVFLIEKRSEHFFQDQAGKFEVDLPSDFGERIRKREYASEPTDLAWSEVLVLLYSWPRP